MKHRIKVVFVVIWGDQIINFIKKNMQNTATQEHIVNIKTRTKFSPRTDSPVSSKRALMVLWLCQ